MHMLNMQLSRVRVWIYDENACERGALGSEGKREMVSSLCLWWTCGRQYPLLFICTCVFVFLYLSFVHFLSLYLYLCICRNVCFWWTCGHQCSLLLIIGLCVQQPLISLISTSFLYVLFLLFLKDHTKVHSTTGITCFQAVTYSVSQNPFLFPSSVAPEYLLRGNLIYPPDCTINNVFGSFLKISTLHSTSWSSKTRIKTLKGKMLRLILPFKSDEPATKSSSCRAFATQLLVILSDPSPMIRVDPNIILQKKPRLNLKLPRFF